MTAGDPRRALLAFALVALACGSTTRDPASNAGAGGGGAGGEGGTPAAGVAGAVPGGAGAMPPDLFAAQCFDSSAAPNCHEVRPGVTEPVSAEVLIGPDTVGPGARFTELSEGAALAELSTGEQRVVSISISFPDDVSIGVLEVDAASGVRVLDAIAQPGHAFLPSNAAVALGRDGDVCHLLTLQGDDGVLRVEPEWSLPDGASVEGLFFGYDSEICAFGLGVYCFDGAAWRVELAPEIGHFVAATAGAALRDNGTLFVSAETGWTSTFLAGDEALDTVYPLGGGFGVTGPNGAWYAIAADSTSPSRCVQNPPPLWSNSYSFLVDGTGTVYSQRYPRERWCRASAAPVPDLRAVSLLYCGISPILLGMTETALVLLLGPITCAID